MTAQFFSATTLAIALAVPLSHGQDGPTGYLPLTAEQQAYADANMIKVTRASPNRLALERVEAEQQKNRTILAPGTVIPSAAEDGSEVFGYKGATDPSPAGRFSLNATSMAYPRKVDNSKEAWFPVVGSQAPFGSCASYSSTYYTMTSQVARLRGWNVKADNNPAHIFSPRFTYNLLNNGADSGSNHLSAFWIMCSTGCATYADFPYIPTDCLSWPTQASVWRQAINYRMKETGAVVGLDTEGGLAIAKQMIADGYVFNFAAYIGGWQWVSLANDPATSADDYLFASETTDNARLVVSHCNAGGVDHAMTVVGYDDDVWSDLNANGVVDPSEKGALRIVNSWGESFKDKGFTWVSYDSLKSTSAVAGFTTATRQPTFADKSMDWVSARASYTPALVAEVTATHGQRNQMELNVGCGSTSQTQPSSKKWFGTLTGAGGALSFNGTNIPVEATFVVDCTDLINKPNNARWFAFFGDGNGPSTGTLSKVRFIDSGNAITTVNTTNPSGGLPQVANNSVVYAYSDNAMPTNAAPVVKDQVTRVISGVSSSILLDGSDDNSDNLTYSIVTGPSHGTLSTSGANRFYTSNSTYQGVDSFTYKANDGKADSNVGTVTIQVGAAGSGVLAQFFYAINQQTLPDLTGRISELTRIDSQINYQSISEFPTAFISHFAARHTGYINIPTTGSYTFYLNANDAANLWLDGNLIATKYSSGTVTLTAGYHSLRTEYCQEYDTAALRLSWSGPNIGQAIVPASVLFSPEISNVAPVAQSQNVSIIGDKLAPVAIPLLATDGNQDLLGYATSTPAHGTLFGVGANMRYLPDPGYVGADSFTFKVNDGMVDSNIATITITISTNAPPTVATAATAAPNIVTTGTTTTLNVLGANDGGEDSLVYTWAATGTPPAAVSFSGNGTNGGKTSTATFNKTGNYTFQCTIKDAGNLTVVSNSVAVTVNRAETADVVLVPNAATINIAGIQQFTVGRRDQFGNVLEDQIPYIWSLSDSTSGSISPTGLFRANLTTGGPYTVSATGGGKTFSATITVGAFSVPPGPEGFTWCANEGGSFTLLEPSDVAFGMTGRYAYKLNQTGTIVFNNTTFYPDPAPGQFKYGFVKPVSTNKPPTLVSVASATTTPSGTNVTLNALGVDDTGEPGLTYTWQTLGTPPAAVTFGANGSNTAKSSTATCPQPGLYVLRCTIMDVGNKMVTSDVVATVVAGTTPVELNPLPITSGLVLRMDASQISDTLDGAQVNTWADTSGAANHAARQATSSSGYPKYVASGINGKPVVRFNSPTQNTGDYLKFSRLSTIRTVFWVLKENAGLADYPFLLGDGLTYDFHRGATPNGPLWSVNHTSSSIRGGATKLMGNLINGTTTSLPSGNFQLVSLVTTGNVSADQICQDRTYHGSWQGDIAEILIYNRALIPAEEVKVGTYLATKYGLVTNYPLLVIPAIPTGLAATPSSPGGIRVSWASVSGAASYNIWCRNTQSGVQQIVSSNTSPSFVSGLVVGTPYEFKVSAVSADNIQGNYSAAIMATPTSVASAYSTWTTSAGIGLTAGMNNNPMDDPDRDGIPNMLEFALGGAPMSHSRAILPTMTMVGSNCVFEYSRSDVSQAGTSQVVEYSSDLRVWSQIAITDQSSGPVVVTAGNPSDRVKVTIPATAGQKMFTRLKVIQ